MIHRYADALVLCLVQNPSYNTSCTKLFCLLFLICNTWFSYSEVVHICEEIARELYLHSFLTFLVLVGVLIIYMPQIVCQGKAVTSVQRLEGRFNPRTIDIRLITCSCWVACLMITKS